MRKKKRYANGRTWGEGLRENVWRFLIISRKTTFLSGVNKGATEEGLMASLTPQRYLLGMIFFFPKSRVDEGIEAEHP